MGTVAKYRSLFDSIGQGFCIIEVIFDGDRAVDYRFIEVNAAFERHSGLTDATGKRVLEFIPALDQHWFDLYGRVAITGQSERFENVAEAIGRYFEVYAVRVGEPEQRQVAVLFTDITERKRAEELKEFRLKLSDALRGLADVTDIHEAVTRTARDYFQADRCYYVEIEGSKTIIRMDNSREGLPSIVGTYELSDWPLFKSVIDAGQPFVVDDTTKSDIVDADLKQRCVETGVVSILNVPVIKNNIPAGVLCITQGTARKWTDFEVSIATETADRTWSAVEHARTLTALQKANERVAYLLRLSDALRTLSDLTMVQAMVTRTAMDHFNADRCYYGEIDGDVAIVRQDARTADLPSVVGSYQLSETPIFKSALNIGRPFVIEDSSTSEQVDEHARPRYADKQIASQLIVPIVKNGVLVGALTLAQSTPRNWTDIEFDLAVETAERAWFAVEHARTLVTLREVNDLLVETDEHKNEVSAALRTREEWKEYLLTLSDKLRFLSDTTEVHATATATARDYFGADRCYYCEVENDMAIIRMDNSREGLPSVVGAYPLKDFPTLRFVLDSGRPMVVENVCIPGAVDENLRTTCIQLQIGSFISVPVIKNNIQTGLFAVTQCTPRKWTDLEVEIATETADRAWSAVERARALVALRDANERLTQADQHKNEFLAILSHELRNPLAPIRSAIQLLDQTSDQAIWLKGVLDRQTHHMVRLVDDLLDVTRISRGKILLQRESVELTAIAKGTVEDHREMFLRRGIELQVINSGGHLWIDGDRTRLVQVIGNLLMNSLKFTRRGGQTVVTVEVDADRAVVRVRDNGVGMSGETLQQLFKPFMQAAQTLDRSRGGLGLGLALVKGLVELHDGAVTARSDGEGKGSEFVIRLPLQVPVSVAVNLNSNPVVRARPKSRSVLIVEDHLDSAETLRQLLSQRGHKVSVAYTGPDGLEVARSAKPEVILCDIGLPGIDGYEVARSIRADSDAGLQQTFLVALTGYARPEDVAKSRAAGFDRHLAKPPTIQAIEKLLDEAGSTS